MKNIVLNATKVGFHARRWLAVQVNIRHRPTPQNRTAPILRCVITNELQPGVRDVLVLANTDGFTNSDF
jgi:hypothetical protein